MDPRTHVALALARLHADPAPLPEIGTLPYRSRLLDETGGDFRPLVMFLLQLAEADIPAQIEAAAGRGERWEETHRRLALAWASEHYTQPEMARWGVAAWGAALKRCPVPAEPRPEPEPAHGGVSQVAPPASARGAAGRTTRGLPAPSRPTFAPTNPSATTSPMTGMARGAGGRPYFNRAEKQALVSIGLTGLVAAALIAIMSPGMPDELPPTSTMRGAPATSTAPAVAPTAAPVAGRAGAGSNAGGMPPAATVDSAALAPLPPIDPIAIARLTPGEGAARLRGTYRISTRRQGVNGDDRCNALAATIAWNQSAVDTIMVDLATASFRFATRPTLSGTMGPGGTFTSRTIASEKDGTRTSYQLQGQLIPWGFEATSITRSESTLRWRRTLACEFVASLSGERVP